jgi:hypothetical protein
VAQGQPLVGRVEDADQDEDREADPEGDSDPGDVALRRVQHQRHELQGVQPGEDQRQIDRHVRLQAAFVNGIRRYSANTTPARRPLHEGQDA